MGFTGSLTIVGDEPHEPYDRPPLSKAALTDWVPPEHTGLPRLADLGDVDWRLGVAATALDRRAREVVLADGTRLPYDRVLVATGVRNRPWPNAEQAALEGVRGIRTREDSRVIRDHLDAGPEAGAGGRRRVHRVGGGLDLPSAGAAGHGGGAGREPAGGSAWRGGGRGGGGAAAGGRRRSSLQRHGGGAGGQRGRFRAASLSDGTTVEAGLAVIALGALRNTGWLADSGLACGPLGVSCDPGGRAYAVNGMAVEDVFAAGDVARFPHALYEYEFLALEHWENAVAGAQVAAHNMICDDPDRRAHVSVPAFWSVQFGTNIKSVGVPSLAGQILVTQGSAKQGRFAAAYLDGDRMVAAVTFNHGRYLEYYRHLIERASPAPVPVGEAEGNVAEDARFPDPGAPYEFPPVVVSGHSPTSMEARRVPAGKDQK